LVAENTETPVPALIFDTDIVVWMTRNRPAALQFARGVRPTERNVSVISYLELLYGSRNQEELMYLQQLVAGWFTEILPVTAAITGSARRLMEDFALSHRPNVSDVLVAATALDRREPLATCNAKHYRFVPGLQLRIFRASPA
jgi:predicted nucleic acid-binding protein